MLGAKDYLLTDEWTSTKSTCSYFREINSSIISPKYTQNYNSLLLDENDLTTASTSVIYKKYTIENWLDTTRSNTNTLYQIYNTTSTGTCYKFDDGYGYSSPRPLPMPTAVDRLRDIIRDRCSPRIVTRNSPVISAQDIREVRARQTLRRVIGDDRFRQFLAKGFITVRAVSGRIYQIFPGHKFTHVWENGAMIERLCVVLKGDFPPTDSIIMRFLLILNDEHGFWKIAVKHGAVSPTIRHLTPDNRNLTQIFEELKLRAA